MSTRSKYILAAIIIFVFFVFVFAVSIMKPPPPASLKSTPIPYVPASSPYTAPRTPQTVTNPSVQKEREEILETVKPQLEKGEIKARIEGANKDVLVFISKSLSNIEMIQLLRGSLDDYRSVGFSQIKVTDKSGETRTIDLTALDE